MVFTSADSPSQIGFIVSKTVGNAVTRNLVKRRLREIVVETLRQHPYGVNVVVRALPVSAAASFSELVTDYRKACSSALSRIQGKSGASLPATPAPAVDKVNGPKGGEVL